MTNKKKDANGSTIPAKVASPAAGSAMDDKKPGTTSGTEDYGSTENKGGTIPVNDKQPS
jgi:hypothetical protein